MRIIKLKIENFRGIKHSEILLSEHSVFVGDNNTGKSTILEALDLVLGPERLSKFPIIDEHDFYAGEYLDEKKEPIPINIEVIVIDLSEEQQRRFRSHLEWWDSKSNSLLDGPPPERTDEEGTFAALRIGFKGSYEIDEDNFFGKTFFLSPLKEDGSYDTFGQRDKRSCGFLFLRTLRTGSRALSLEHGSLLDIILKLQELRLNMWEDILERLRELPVAEKKEIGITEILTSIQSAVRTLVPSEWANNPHMRISDLTRENLRKVITVFMGTGAIKQDGLEYSAPFQHQGTGTINTLVLSLLSMIAELKQNVIFAMEEPEIAIPPHAQKRIVKSITSKSAQTIFTSHSPFVLEEFKPYQILVIKKINGELTCIPAEYPPTIKPKRFREEFRRRFCEALLARRVLITEGKTEYDAISTAARRLNELQPEEFKTLEALGIGIINAETETQIAPLGNYFRNLGKIVYAFCDKQNESNRERIVDAVNYLHESPEKGFEDLVLKGTNEKILRKFINDLVFNDEWPSHIPINTESDSFNCLIEQLKTFMCSGKGSGIASDILNICNVEDMPEYIKTVLKQIKETVE